MTVILNPQILASDPKVSCFVTANAGSGKTTTLVGRVARLLLSGAKPEGILCVTYTKAAAAEMQSRLFERLGAWSVADDAQLAKELERVGEDPARFDLAEARALFAKALETPGGLKIQTLHAFCEKLLRRFPLEAGVAPGFEVLDDSEGRTLKAKVRADLAEAVLQTGGVLQAAFDRLILGLPMMQVEALFSSFEAERDGLIALFPRLEAHERGFEGAIYEQFGLESVLSLEDLEAGLSFPEADYRRWGKALLDGSKTDQGRGEILIALANRCLKGDAPGLMDRLSAFATKSLEPTKTLATKQVKDPDIKGQLEVEQERLFRILGLMRTLKAARMTADVLIVARAYLAAYGTRKREKGFLDFHDLVGKVCHLLRDSTSSAWVLFKLDHGLSHVLLDEAQDTAPEQWVILKALTSEFFSGEGADTHDQARTVFAVGDEKQSIYGFQGAAPEQFLKQRQAYATAAAATGARFMVPSLAESWRSTPEVLRFVDLIFASDAARAALTGPQADEVRHIARRSDGPGQVDLWPLVQSESSEAAEAWDEPLDSLSNESAIKRLARKVAEEVARLIREGDQVFDKDTKAWRAAHAGDVIILVRGRGSFFEEIIRALKKSSVPVAGADRLILSSHILFKDLLGLAQFCLFPSDDLTLAALLRSPLCNLSEQDLYDLAADRTGTLWAALSQKIDASSGEERARFEQARAILGWARAEAARSSPFDFYSRLMARRDRDGLSMRQRILTRLGREAEEALDVFINHALEAEGRGLTDLERFVADLQSAELEIKREMEGGRQEVRVMTVHGSKGLEAPIVILPDLTRAPRSVSAGLQGRDDGFYLYLPSGKEDTAPTEELRNQLAAKEFEEGLRLLYVGLTRARDRLILAGKATGRSETAPAKSWYGLIQSALAEARAVAEAAGEADPFREIEFADGSGSFLRFGPDPTRAHLPHAKAAPEQIADLPDWARRPAPAEGGGRWATASSLEDGAKEGPSPSPLAQTSGLGRFRRGQIIHKLFEILPDLPEAARQDAAARLLAKEPGLTADQRQEMTAAVFDVLEDPRFSEVFGPGSRPEVALSGTAKSLPEGYAVAGRMDRLVVSNDRVLIIDYKTNRPAPDHADEAEEAYLRQMAAYVALLRDIYPARQVEAAFVWTDGPKLTPLSDETVARALRLLHQRAARLSKTHDEGEPLETSDMAWALAPEPQLLFDANPEEGSEDPDSVVEEEED